MAKLKFKVSLAPRKNKENAVRLENRDALLSAAKSWQRRGCAVVPVTIPTAGKPRSGKAPLTRHGFRDATKDFEVFKTLVKGVDDFNLGLATGAISGIIVIDIDPRNGGRKSLKEAKKKFGELPRTWKSITGGGGHHLFFRYPGTKIKSNSNRSMIGPGVDILSDNSQAVLPPSLHKSGKRYCWFDNRSPDDCELAELPPRWLAALSGAKTLRESEIADDVQTWPEGTRNTNLTQLAGHLHAAGLSRNALEAALVAENSVRCVPPLNRDEVKRIARNIGRRPRQSKEGLNDVGRQITQALLDQEYNGGKWLLAIEGEFMRYTKGVWSPIPRAVIERQFLQLLPKLPAAAKLRHSAIKREVVDLLTSLQAREGDPFRRMKAPSNVINCKNGELWFEEDGTVDFRDHRADSFLEHQIPIRYEPDASCPLSDKTLLEIFGNADDPEALVTHWNELCGYVIQPTRPIPIIPILRGTGSNGKTKLVETLIKMIGTALVYSGRVSDLGEDRFTLGSLCGKRLFVDDDVKSGTRLPDGELKRLSESKILTGEQKFKPKFQFESRVVVMLLCNNIPSVADISHGFQRRLHVIPFDRVFAKKEEVRGLNKDQVAKEERGLFEKIWAEELPGTLNRAVEGWARVKLRGLRFATIPDIERTKEELLVKANPIKGFLDERCVRDPNAKVLFATVYAAFREWAQRAGITMIQQRSAVRQNLEHQGFRVNHSSRGQMLLGVRLKTSNE